MAGLQGHVAHLDPLGRMRIAPGFGEGYVELLFERLDRENGRILVAETEGRPAGIAAAALVEQNAADLLEIGPARYGVIFDLFVVEALRGRGIGRRLMEATEAWLRAQGCTILMLEVFAPNRRAHDFYRRLGYVDRSIWMSRP